MPYTIGQTVQAFDPRTLGVVKWGTITKVGRKWITIDFGLTGTARITERDIVA